ncbi:WD40 repeat-like protein [Leucogyrophana mollusca]|uniref:WD40 repeat-like protein n=1 Tax=Leucogyrophana mollusca TaxID=85980 RepID=A0ACB8B3B0_9AGAM|nr:WD40 repeat-like protein [Leucogyrophana mollusca]
MSTLLNTIEAAGVRRASRHPTKVRFEGQGWINSIAYFPDGRHIASASNDKTIIIWDVESGRQDGQPLQHDFGVGHMAISPDGRRIASGMREGGAVVWDVLTRRVVHKIQGHGAWMLAYSPDGRWIASAPIASNEREIRLWDADTGRPGGEPLKCDGGVFCVAFSSDGSQIAAGFEDGSFQVIDIATGDSAVGPIKGHTDFVRSIAYSPGGRLLLTASWDKSIRVWDSKTGVQVGKPMLGHKDAVNWISITADGRRVASGGNDTTVRVWDLATRLQVGDPFDADGRVSSVAFSPDSRYIISGGNYLCLFDTESFAIQGPVSLPIASAQNAPVGRTPISCPDKPQKVREHAHSVTSSILGLPAVHRGIHQAIARFCNALSKPQISVSLAEAPNDWLRANTSQIVQVPSINEKQRAEVHLIYPRLFVYTLEYLECYAPRRRV